MKELHAQRTGIPDSMNLMQIEKQDTRQKREFLRPSLEAKKPEIALPMIQPISALDDVMPCIASVYSKSAPMKKA